MRRHIITCLCLLFPLFCAAQESMLAIVASAKSVGMLGFGIILTIENIETHEVYQSKTPLGGMSRIAVIEHLPAGVYEVRKAVIPFGNIRFRNESAELGLFFGTIEVAPNTGYYFGRYKSTFQGKLLHRKVVFSLVDYDMPKNMVTYIEEKGYNADDFIQLTPQTTSFDFYTY